MVSVDPCFTAWLMQVQCLFLRHAVRVNTTINDANHEVGDH